MHMLQRLNTYREDKAPINSHNNSTLSLLMYMLQRLIQIEKKEHQLTPNIIPYLSECICYRD